MKRAVLALALLATPALVTPIWAAPTCQDRNGDTIRCGAPSAMPVNWRLPPEEAQARKLAYPRPPAAEIWKVAGLLALFFALIALLPRFDGRRDQDWQ